MKKSVCFNPFRILMASIVCMAASMAQGQVTFTAQANVLQMILGWSYNDCCVDANGDHLDDVVRVTADGIYVDYQQGNGTFTGAFYPMAIVNLPSWSICAADIDANGYTDLMLGAGDAVSFVYANSTGTGYTEIPQPEYIFTQRTTFFDIDNDGNLDAFACHDVDQCHPYRNTSGMLSLDISLLPTLDAGGNYAAIWCDYDNDGDGDLYITKCRGGAPWGDAQRINLLYRNNADGTFSSVGPQANMDDGNQSWATVFEDFDNDGDFDAFTVNHASSDTPGGAKNKLMRNNGDGTFTDITADSGINATDLGAWNCDAGDFDNNGFVDIFSELTKEMYWNNGDGTFTGGDLNFDSGGIGDLNNDGFLDVITGNVVYRNNGNNNNWVKFDLEGLISNRDGIGARIEIYGSWGVQVREVRAGRSFSPAGSLIAHFGLGTASAITQAVVKWPSGVVSVINNPSINTTHIVPEVGCTLPANTIEVNGSTQICPGQSVTLTASSGSSYSWSNGATGQSIEVSQPGTYSVIIWDELGCASVSNNVVITAIVDTPPTVSAVGETMFCQGGSVILTSSIGSGYSWSNGATGQSIIVTEPGLYSVSVSGICSGTVVQSEAIEVSVLAAPAPQVTGSTIGEPGTAILQATGSNLEWFASQFSSEVLGTGEQFETDFFTDQISYWVQSTTVYGGELQYGGKPDNSGSGGLPASGGRLYFDAWEPFTLLSVKVYVPTDATAGVRTVQLFDEFGNVIMQQDFDLLVGEHVLNLNWPVPVANGLSIGCQQNNLFRNSGTLAFPYAVGTVGSITTTTNGTGYYYYFYDWKIQRESVACVSQRVEVTAYVVGVNEWNLPTALHLFPNPVEDELRFETGWPTQALLQWEVLDATGRVVMSGNIKATVPAIQLSELSGGIYRLRVTSQGTVATGQFVKW